MSTPRTEPRPTAEVIRGLLRGGPAPADGNGPAPARLSQSGSGLIRRPAGIGSATPSGSSPADASDEMTQLRAENQELRTLIEQAIAQEEEFDRLSRGWKSDIESRDLQIRS